jgi:hypothetical protein
MEPNTHRVRVTTLGDARAEFPGRIEDSSHHALRLIADRSLPAGSPVMLEMDENLLLGEVMSCRPRGVEFSLCVDLEHSLIHTRELAKLARQLVGEAAGQPDRAERTRS